MTDEAKLNEIFFSVNEIYTKFDDGKITAKEALKKIKELI